jgi:hypothetical protein
MEVAASPSYTDSPCSLWHVFQSRHHGLKPLAEPSAFTAAGQAGRDASRRRRSRARARGEHSVPAVSQTVARMQRDGLLTVTSDRRIQLTPEGAVPRQLPGCSMSCAR